MFEVIPFKNQWILTCPKCGLKARIDQDQFEGKVSVDCPECEFHETHDFRPFLSEKK